MPCARTPDGLISANASFSYPAELRERVRSYYQNYYRRFGIRNVDVHVAKRLIEEQEESRRLALHEEILNRRFSGCRTLVVGMGTGGLAVCLSALGNESHGIEPNNTALQIAGQKMEFVGGPKSRLLRGVAEYLPYRDEVFDVVFCYTVLEHVRDVRQSLEEMVRVIKPGGVVIISTPEYRFPLEHHYKVPLPLKPFPRWFSAAVLLLAGKPTRPLFEEITYVTSKQIQHILMNMPKVRFLRSFAPYPAEWRDLRCNRSRRDRLFSAVFRLWSKHFEIYRNQEYYILKSFPYGK